MVDKGLVLQIFMLFVFDVGFEVEIERRVVLPLVSLILVRVVVAGFFLRDGEDVGMRRGEGAHAVN